MSKLQVGGHTVEISRTEKVLFPDDGITKGDLINYYADIGDIMLPHVKGRPVTMIRYPNGINGQSFFQKTAPKYFPDWIPRVEVETEAVGRKPQVVINDSAALVYLANQACIGPHIWLSCIDNLDHPDKLVFDLDPPDDNFSLACKTAKSLRGLLEDELGLTAFVMTSGSKGLHVVVPLDDIADFDASRTFAQDVAELMALRNPEELTTEPRIEKRENRLYLDSLRNSYGQTSVAPYAVRPKPGAPAAAPLDWTELDNRKLNARTFTLQNIPQRLKKQGDPWKNIWDYACSISEAREALDDLM